MDSALIKLFSKNRAEEFSVDVWGEYVLPPHYDTINLFNYDKAVMIEGSRGSGKTMFLRYHCHDTRFSEKRKNIDAGELKHIGIYFRPDTHFCSCISSDVYDSDWEKIFGKYILINVLKEFARVCINISKCRFSFDFPGQAVLTSTLLPANFNGRVKAKVDDFAGLADYADLALSELNDWVNDPESYSRPVFPDTRSIISSLIESLRKQNIQFAATKFHLYVDEYENLTAEQQKLVNTWIKHGSSDFILSAAYKKYGMVSRETRGFERLVHRNDYRKIDLEKFEDVEFQQFAAEILILKLDGYVEEKSLSHYKAWLCSEELLTHRVDNEYSSQILDFAKSFFPATSYEAITSSIFKDATLKKRLRDFLIKPQLKTTELSPELFINSKYPVESIINGVLLNRKSQSSKKILVEFQSLIETGDNSFYKPFKDVLVGAILWIYISAGRRVVPVYSGFERICKMARFNLRHFLEFCHQCLVEQKRSKENNKLSISVELQALAARRNSELEVEKAVELGRYGNNLRFIVNRLGLFFQLLQKRKSQSEPEIVHFGIEVASIEQLPENLQLLLRELKIWSVLIEFHGDTKRKSQLNFTTSEYMLHPMFAPNFSISFRKIRKHMFSVKNLEVIFCGSEDAFISFCTPYVARASEDQTKDYRSANEIQGSLFDDF